MPPTSDDCFWADMADAMQGLVDLLDELALTPDQVRQITALIDSLTQPQ